jgi:hypothetical protein
MDFGAAGVVLVTNLLGAEYQGPCLVIFFNEHRKNDDGTKGAWESPWGTNDGPPKHLDAVDTARDELFEETGGLIYCPRCVLENAPNKSIPPSKEKKTSRWITGLRVDESLLNRGQFKKNRSVLQGLTKTGRKISCMLEMSRMTFIPLAQLEENAHKLEKASTETVKDIDGKDCLLSKLGRMLLRKGGLKIAREAFDAGPITTTCQSNIDRFPWKASRVATALNGLTTIRCAPLAQAIKKQKPIHASELTTLYLLASIMVLLVAYATTSTTK